MIKLFRIPSCMQYHLMAAVNFAQANQSVLKKHSLVHQMLLDFFKKLERFFFDPAFTETPNKAPIAILRSCFSVFLKLADRTISMRIFLPFDFFYFCMSSLLIFFINVFVKRFSTNVPSNKLYIRAEWSFYEFTCPSWG